MGIYDLGEFLLRLAIVSSAFGLALVFMKLWRFSYILLWTTILSIFVSNIFLLYALISGDFSLTYVIGYTSKDLPLFYKFTAWWGGQAGSIMFWLFILSLYSAIFTVRNRSPFSLVVVFSTFIFFLITTVYAANPFERLPIKMPDGRGLNPLLQNVWMAIHPPLLYLGYVGTTFSAALSLEAVFKGFDRETLDRTRIWIVIPWIFLTTGILLGGRWAYLELGWGGYWAWDPVENASFLPWITLTAAIHTYLLVKLGSHRLWFFNLAFGSYFLSILGTFLTRSGIVESVHAFAFSDIGHYFMAYLSIWSVIWTITNGIAIKFRNKREYKALTRGWYLSLSNYLWMATLFAVILGTFFPIITEIITALQITPSKDYYTYATSPFFALAAVFSTLSLESGWDKPHLKIHPFAAMVSLIVSVVLAVFTKNIFVFAGVLISLYGIMHFLKNTNLLRRSPSHLAHFGFVLTSMGIVLSWNLGKAHEISFKPGETKRFYVFELKHLGWEEYKGKNYDGVYAILNVKMLGRNLGDIKAERRVYNPSGEVTSEAGILPVFPVGDLYAVIQGAEDDGRFFYEVYFNPGIQIVWIGPLIIALAGLMSIFMHKQRRASGK